MCRKASLFFIMLIYVHVYKGLPYLNKSCLCACLKRPSLSSSCLSVRMCTKAFLLFIMPICAHVYKGLPYLNHACLCACLNRPSLSSVCILITGSLYRLYSIHRTHVTLELEQWHLGNAMLKVSCSENSSECKM